MEKVLLFGNGLNRIIDGFPSWNEIVSGGSFVPKLGKNSKMPYDMIYEISSLRNSSVKVGIKKKLKDNVKSLLKGGADLSKYETLIELPFDHYLTTNYDNILYHLAIMRGFVQRTKDKTEDHYNLRRYYGLEKDDRKFRYWPIHGDVEVVESMMIGYNHYCGCCGKMYSYLKGSHYEYDTPGGHKKSLRASIETRWKSGKLQKHKPFISWIDLIFCAEIHILGLSLIFDEIDLWWLLDYRSRMIEKGIISEDERNNIYFYYIDTNPDILDALNEFGVITVSVDKTKIKWETDSEGNNIITNFSELYDDLISEISSRVK